jgi:hypothetical protein
VRLKRAKKATASKNWRGSPPARPGRSVGPRDKDLEAVLSAVTAKPETKCLEQWLQISCPYCSEDFEVHVTSEDEGQTLSEDCHVCCRPVSIHVHEEEGELQVEAQRS